jgi:PAS domain S-box-containing protein
VRRQVSLELKFLAGTVLVLCLVMAASIAVVEHRQRATHVREVQRRGEVIARNLAAVSVGPLLLYNFTALEQNVVHTGREADVVYALVLDAEGKVAAHSRHPELVGERLAGGAHEGGAAAEALLIQDTEDPERGEALYDFSVPVFVDRQKWGTVRVGLSKRRMEAEIRRTRWELGLLTGVTLLLGGAAAALVARRISRPVRQLAQAAVGISRGELNQRIEPASSDEIGHLALAFNHMATQLLEQRSALEAAHGELGRRFEELADLKSYTDSILGSIPSGIITIDLEGRVVTLNPAAELLTGIFLPEAAGRYCTEVFAHAPEVVELLMETLSRRSGGASATLGLRRRTGRVVPVEASAAPLRGAEGKELGVVGVFRDVSAVRELEEQLRRSDRLAALGTFAAGLAHEIKNPLTSLRTFSRLLSQKFEDARFRETFERVVPRELERINAIVDRLLQLARPTRLHVGPVRLPLLLDRALELHAAQIEAKQVEVEREYAAGFPTIQADAEHLYQAVLNLVGNALEAMASGGRLVLRVGWGEEEDLLLHARPRRHVRVEIEDTGVGIPPDEVDKVFDPFFTTKAGGTGLGLAVTHKIIEDHGGTISVRSVPGRGTTFKVLLPLVPHRGTPARGDEA